MITQKDLDTLRIDVSIKSKNGIDFTLAASIIWLMVSYIWTLEFTSYDKSILTFIVGSLMLPLASVLSKLLKTTWTNKDNPLQQLGLWINFAQLFYFPFLVFTLSKMPDYFVMVYTIITGAHFFLYSWFYKTYVYGFFAAIMVVIALIVGLIVTDENMYFVPLCMSFSLLILTILLYFDCKCKISELK